MTNEKVKNIGHNLAVSFSINELIPVEVDNLSLVKSNKIKPSISTFAIEKNGEFIFQIIVGFPKKSNISEKPEYTFTLIVIYKDILDNIYRQKIKIKALLLVRTKEETGWSHVELKIITVEKPQILKKNLISE